MNVFLKYIKPYSKSAILACVLMVFQVGADLLQPVFLARIVDNGIKTGNMQLIIRTGIIMIVIALGGFLSGIGCTTASSYASMSFSADLRKSIFVKIQEISFNDIDKYKTSSLITRLTNDVNQVQNIVLMSMRVLIRAPLLCIGGLIMAIRTDSQLAIIFIFVIPILVLSIIKVIRRAFPLFITVQEKLDRVNTVMRENLSGVRVIKAFVRHDFEKKRFDKANEDLKAVTIDATKIMVIIMPIMMTIMNLSVVGVLFFGGVLYFNNNIYIGEIMAFINYITLILFSLLMMAFVLMMFSRAKASSDRITQVLNTPDILSDESNKKNKAIKKGNITFDNVTFSYSETSEPVLKNISFNIKEGETIGILGGTGSGKSTLISLIPRLYEVTKGRILIDDMDIKDLNVKTLRESISIVLQESILFSGSIKENIRWGNKTASLDEVVQSAKIAKAHDFIMKFKEGYDMVLSKRAVNVSGGQKQRISIARALLKNPKILILDDSTSAVDSVTEKEIQKGIKDYIKDTTCIIIAQKISTVKETDKIILMDNGQIINVGTHDELIKCSQVYKEIYKSQYGKVQAK